MRRRPVDARAGWREIVEAQGLTYAVGRDSRGGTVPYWHEHAAYEFSEDQITYLEDLTERLHGMCIEAAHHILGAPRLLGSLGLPRGAEDLLRHSLASEQAWSLYGRFDLAWDGGTEAKLLEYNADTPAGLVEAAVSQWHWLEDTMPANDQWNMLHERLVQGWERLARLGSGRRVHLAVGQDEPTEDWATVAYLTDTAREAGLETVNLTMEAVGWQPGTGRFVDLDDLPLDIAFKMYPWEWMLREEFGRHLLAGADRTRWVEPLWKTLLGSKTILVALTEIYPDHRNLLPAYLDTPGDLEAYVAKPVYGWEGAGVQVVTGDFTHTGDPRHTSGQRMVHQQYTPLPRFDGPDVDRAYPVLGTWFVNGHAAGMGIRESSGPVTDAGARFVPHYMTTPRSTPEQVRAWLDDPAGAVG